MIFQLNKRKSYSEKKDYIYAARLSFRKRIPNHFSLFFILIALKYMPPILITSTFTNIDNPSFSLWKFLNHLTFFQNGKPLINITYHCLCGIIYALLLCFFIVEIYLQLRIKLYAKSIDVYQYRRDNSLIKLPTSYKRIQRFNIAMYFVFMLLSQHISEILFYGIFDVFGMFDDISNPDKDKVNIETMLNYHKRHVIDKYFIFGLNVLALMYLIYIMFRFFDLFCKQHFKESYGFGIYFTLFSKIYIVFVSNLQAFYTVSVIYKEEARKNFLFYISFILLCFNIAFIVNVILLKKTFLEYVELYNFALVNICSFSSLYDMAAYLLMKKNITLHLVHSIPRIGLTIFNGIFLAKVIKFCNERSLQQIIQKHFFNYHQDTFYSEINKYIRAFLYLARLLPETTDPSNVLNIKLREIARKHSLQCENKNCLCKTLQQHSDKSLINGYHVIFRNVFHSLLKLLKKSQYTKKRYYQLLYINEVNFEHLVLNNNIKALYLSQLYLEAKSIVSEPYQFYEIRKIINRKYKLKNITVKDENTRNYLRDTVKAIQEIFKEEENNEKLQQLMYEICSGVEEVFKIKSIISTNNKVDITSDELLIILEKMLLTQKMLTKSINAYLMTKHSHSNEIKYLLNQFNSIIPLNTKDCGIFFNKNSSAISSLRNDLLSKDEDSYLIIYINSHNEILIKSISLKLLDILKYTKREMCDMEFTKLLPVFLGEVHNKVMIDIVTNTKQLNESYNKISFMLTKRRDLIRIHFTSTIFPSFERAIYLIIKITKLDLIDNERNYQYYYMLSDENYNIISMSPEFTSDFCINQKMLKRYQINLPHLFNINQDKLFKYFNTKNKKDTKASLLNVATLVSTNTLESKSFFDYHHKYKFLTMYERIHKETMVLSLKKVLKKHQEHGINQEEQKRLQHVISTLMQTHTLQWNTSPNSLNVRTPIIKKQSKDSNNDNNNINNNEYIYLKLERRFLESQCYFIVRIRICRKIFETKRKGGNHFFQIDSISKISSIKNAGTYIGVNGSSSKNILFKKSKINIETSPGSRTSKFVKGFITNSNCSNNFHSSCDVNGSHTSLFGNNSNVGMFSQQKLQTIADANEEDESSLQPKMFDFFNKKNYSAMVPENPNNSSFHSNLLSKHSSKKVLILRKQTFTSKVQSMTTSQSHINENINNSPLNKTAHELSNESEQTKIIILKQLNKQFTEHLKQNSYIKIFQGGLYIILAILCIISFMSNKSILDNSLSIFHLNSYAFMVSLDIFYCSLICLRGCLIHDNLHIAKSEQYEAMKIQSQNQLIHHYHKFMHLVNRVVTNQKGNEIFEILNSEGKYFRLMADWEEKETTSHFLDEIRQIYFYISNFNLTNKINVCRIRQVFINEQYIHRDVRQLSPPSDEEKFVHYICKNIMNQLSTHLDKLTTQTTKLVKIFSSQSQVNSLTINAGIVVVALVIYFTVIIMIRLENKFFYDYLISIVQQKDGENEYVKKLIRLKYLIYNFSYEECRKYEMGPSYMGKHYQEGNSEYHVHRKETPNSLYSPIHKHKKLPKSYYNDSLNSFSNSDIVNNSTYSLLNYKQNQSLSSTNSNVTISSMYTYTNIKKVISQFPEPSVTKKVNIIVIILFIMFIILQITNFTYSISFFKNLFIRNQVSMSFSSQIPKLSEFFLYAVISIMLNAPYYIKKTESDYKEITSTNILDTSYDYTKDSMYALVGQSNYYFLYYQLTIYRLNVNYFLSKHSINSLFKETGEIETEYLESNPDFCINLQLFYYIYSIDHTVDIKNEVYNDKFEIRNISELFRSVSEFSRICYGIHNGINKSGVKKAIDVHLNQINFLYSEFLNASNKTEEILKVFKDHHLNGLFDNLFFVLKKFHFVTNDIVSKDIGNVLHGKFDTDILFSLSSIIFSFGIILVIIFVIASKIEKFTNIIMNAANLLDYALKHFH